LILGAITAIGCSTLGVIISSFLTIGCVEMSCGVNDSQRDCKNCSFSDSVDNHTKVLIVFFIADCSHDAI
jgi:hypothetical protein